MTNKMSIVITRWIVILILVAGGCIAGPVAPAAAQYPEWSHVGSIPILTTPDGADLPATASVERFPLLVRLSKEVFDFSQAQPDGADIRFSADGKPLAYQIEEWNAAKGLASIWVRIPVIQGNARQEIKLHWGKRDAANESSGAAVFNESNGYVVAMHMGDSLGVGKDEVGTVSPVDAGTAAGPGLIGFARRFDDGKGLACGEKLGGLPSGSHSNTTQAWIKAEKTNSTVVGWGNEQAQGKVVLSVRGPSNVRLDCYFSNADVAGESRLPMSEWVHVVHTYQPGDSRVYVNGRLDGLTARQGSPLNIRTPARMWIGGWYGDYQFRGAIDEVRISNVARSSDWIRLEYENQKPLQTLVGTLVQPGQEFAVTPDKLVLDEGQSRTFKAKAQGADKVYWLLRREGKETVVAVDRFSYTLEAGRVTRDTPLTVRFKAVYPQGAKTVDVPVTVKEAIPEPRFALQSPTQWNGRDTIEVVPVIENREAMQGAGAGVLRTRWSVSGGAVIQQIASDRLILKRSQFSGVLTVRAEIDNGGTAVAASALIQVQEPKSDPWIVRVPDKDEKPEEGQFYARDASGKGTLYYNGTLDQAADMVFLRVFADEKPYLAEKQPLTADRTYSFAVKLEPGLIKYRVELGLQTGAKEKILERVGDLVCGDAYLIDGQSNALATDTSDESPRETSEWIRSYGGPTGREDGDSWVRDRTNEAKKSGLARPNLWCRPVWKRNAPEQQAELGWWGMELAKRLVESQKMPVFVINAAVGGTRIDEHQATLGNRGDLKTIYGRMLWRVQQARMTHQIRAVIWHQGESDQGSDGPTGGYGWETYPQYFVEMSAAWKEDMPNIQHYYIYQIWPNACAMGNGHGDMLREVQRTLPRLYSNMDIISTLGIKPPGGCHYPLEGWTEFARLLQPLVERDHYGRVPTVSITPPNLVRASYTDRENTKIALEFDQPIVWDDSLASQFYVDGTRDEVDSGAASGNVVTLKLKKASAAKKITYLQEMDWSQDKLLIGANGMAALTFCDVPLESAKAKP